MVGVPGLEPGTSSLSGTRSNQLSYTPINKTVRRVRLVRHVQPVLYKMVELQGLEPWTSSLQSWRSSQLSYSPEKKRIQ